MAKYDRGDQDEPFGVLSKTGSVPIEHKNRTLPRTLYRYVPNHTLIRDGETRPNKVRIMNPVQPYRPNQVAKLNEREIMRVLQVHGPLSRAALVRKTGLSAPTISKAVASLLGLGLLEELAAPQSLRGRPANRLQLASDAKQVIGVVIGVERCELVSAGLDGVLHAETEQFPTPATYEMLIRQLIQSCRVLIEKPGITTLGIGVSLPGLTDDRKGIGRFSPNLPITNGRKPAWDLQESLQIPSLLIQESHALCLAERSYDHAVGLQHFAIMDVGAGVGLGVMNRGELLTGTSGFACEIGHITVVMEGGELCGCGNFGCLETICNDAAFVRRINKRLNRNLNFVQACSTVKEKTRSFATEMQETANALAIASSIVINVLNPSHLFIHSTLFDIDAMLLEQVIALTRKRALRPSFGACTILQARGTKQQGAVAAIVQELTNAVAHRPQ